MARVVITKAARFYGTPCIRSPYTFSWLSLAGWPGLGLVLVPLIPLFVSLLFDSTGFVWLAASRDPPLLLVFLVRRPLRGARPPRPLPLPPASGPSQRARFAFPPTCSCPNCRFASFSIRVRLDSASLYPLSIVVVDKKPRSLIEFRILEIEKGVVENSEPRNGTRALKASKYTRSLLTSQIYIFQLVLSPHTEFHQSTRKTR